MRVETPYTEEEIISTYKKGDTEPRIINILCEMCPEKSRLEILDIVKPYVKPDCAAYKEIKWAAAIKAKIDGKSKKEIEEVFNVSIESFQKNWRRMARKLGITIPEARKYEKKKPVAEEDDEPKEGQKEMTDRKENKAISTADVVATDESTSNEKVSTEELSYFESEFGELKEEITIETSKKPVLEEFTNEENSTSQNEFTEFMNEIATVLATVFDMSQRSVEEGTLTILYSKAGKSLSYNTKM